MGGCGTIDLSDFDKFAENLDAMGDNLVDRVMKETAQKTTNQMRAVARMMVHVGRYRPDGSTYTGGELRRSIESQASDYLQRDGDIVSYGLTTHVPHAIFEEYGVGPKGDPDIPHTSRTYWYYYEDGRWYRAKTREAHPYMRPALQATIPHTARFLKDAIAKEFKEAQP